MPSFPAGLGPRLRQGPCQERSSPRDEEGAHPRDGALGGARLHWPLISGLQSGRSTAAMGGGGQALVAEQRLLLGGQRPPALPLAQRLDEHAPHRQPSSGRPPLGLLPPCGGYGRRRLAPAEPGRPRALLVMLGLYEFGRGLASGGIALETAQTKNVWIWSPPLEHEFPRSAPQGTPAVLSYPLLRRMPSPSQSRTRAMPCCKAARLRRAGGM